MVFLVWAITTISLYTTKHPQNPCKILQFGADFRESQNSGDFGGGKHKEKSVSFFAHKQVISLGEVNVSARAWVYPRGCLSLPLVFIF